MLITSGSQRVRWFFFPFKTGGYCLLNDLKQMPVDGSFNNINPLHPNFSMHILLTVLYNSYGTDKENLFNNQELLKLVIILFILMAWTCNSEVIL